ncbi:ABC transporter substrate-binding protein [Pseudomonas fluorescens]|jgi:NitT/TauT family transport system substrate-binding protein|uniref:ABC transporter substrate-binding protein n=1 Tax=Pseudomonas fluorescens TaxID=294 RepID=UPI0027863B5B|nr:ABC transporter substrate-binding protein [Pseudomonas fluorescens]MDP9784398.1 NitT/TauT family transport system substrate-binding protein [Pseudomonas fluorescens]
MPNRFSQVPVVAGLALALIASSSARAEEPFIFMTNWYGQAEHGGYYQALVQGLYKEAGLDVTIKMGGPQINTIQLLAAGKADCIMGSSDIQILKTREQGVPAVTLASVFQKDPQGILAHTDVTRLEDLKDKTILVGTAGRSTYWPWLKATFGLKEEQARPYTFNLQPFIADPNTAIQGYVTYDPYATKKAGVDGNFLLFSDNGWPPYANTIVCMEGTIKNKPKAVAAFVKASMIGWKSYLSGDRRAANEMIKKDNPQMTDEQMDFAVSAMRDQQLVTGGDAASQGIGTITADRLKKTYDFLVGAKIIDPTKVDLQSTFDLQFVQNLKIMP